MKSTQVKLDSTLRFREVCRAMSDPAFYPHGVSCLEKRETHISTVFLTGDWAYKIKKPVDLGFLDFRKLTDRRFFCEREVTLNQRLSHNIYKQIVGIYRQADGKFTLKNNGTAVEYAVKMKQLLDEATLKQHLLQHRIRQSHIEELGAVLASFYKHSERSVDIDRYGCRDVIALNMEENFRQLEPFVGDLLDPQRWEFLCQVSRTFLDHHHDLFERRVKARRICDGHGDLRADHIYFCGGIEASPRRAQHCRHAEPTENTKYGRRPNTKYGRRPNTKYGRRPNTKYGRRPNALAFAVQIIDCIEFNDRFRYGDSVSDLAFLHMDMEHLGFPEWSRALLASYEKQAKDPELYALIDFYATYRAIVRLKVMALRLQQVQLSDQRSGRLESRPINEAGQKVIRGEATRFLAQAYRYAMQFGRPSLWIFCGLPATGKSSLAEQMSKALSIPVLQSDRIRRQGFIECPQVVDFGQGPYRFGMRQQVYAQLLGLAQESLRAGRSVILDATFSRRKWRYNGQTLAADSDANCVFVECVCPAELMLSRLRQRKTALTLSDARLEHFSQFASDFEATTELSPEYCIKVNTDQPLNEALSDLLSQGYACTSYQVKNRIT